MTEWTIGSVFSGIGGLELGLERAGIGRVAWQVEIDPGAQKCLARHWPEAARYGDIREVRGECVKRVDVICGGFPCQDLSSAGKGAGLVGSKSGLWFEFARLIRELRPRVVIVENVPDLASRGLFRVLGDLAQAGFDAEWFTVSAEEAGAPHRRERLFIVAYTNGEGQLQPQGSQPSQRRRSSDCSQEVGCQHEFPPRFDDVLGWDGYLTCHPDKAPPGDGSMLNANFIEAIMGFPAGWTEGTFSERSQQLGNAVMPHVAEAIGLVCLGILQRRRDQELSTFFSGDF